MDLSWLDESPLAAMMAEYAATYPTDEGAFDARSYAVGMMIGVAMMTAPLAEAPDGADMEQFMHDVNRLVAERVAQHRRVEVAG